MRRNAASKVTLQKYDSDGKSITQLRPLEALEALGGLRTTGSSEGCPSTLAAWEGLYWWVFLWKMGGKEENLEKSHSLEV